MTFLSWLDSLESSHRPLVGDKAFLLSQLQQQGYPIVSGFVITTHTFTTFLDLLDNPESLLADFPQSSLYLDVDDPAALQLVAQKSRASILHTSLPLPWLTELVEAVGMLPSPSLIWQLSLFLPSALIHPQGRLFADTFSWTDTQSLEIALKTAWAELFTAKSLFFWQRQGVALEQIRLGVLVQPLIDAITSGYVFVEPEQFQIQATRGLSLSLLRGENEGDSLTIKRSNSQEKSQQIGSKTKVYHPHSLVNTENCLSITWLDDSEDYCLDDLTIQLLINLTNRLLADYPQLKCFEWLTCTENPTIIYLMDLVEAPTTEMTKLAPLLKGLGVSGGIATAPVHILQEKQAVAHHHILVAPRIDPDWLPWLKTAQGIITEEGSATSHGAIIAREFGIPAIVGVKKATEILKNGDLVRVDGHAGLIYAAIPEELGQFSPPTPTFSPEYPIATKLMVNLSQTDSLAALAHLPVDGVGLLRSEWLILELLQIQSLQNWLKPSQKNHFIEQLVERVSAFTQAFYPRPVFYRSLDGNQGKVITSAQDLLGKRGTYNYVLDSSLFDLELQVLKQVQSTGKGNIHLILPFVRSVEEFSFCRQRVIQAGLTQFPQFQLLIMAEVPSVIFLLPHYVSAGVQGIAIGTNDLSQLLLGIDRENMLLSKQFNPLHPAFLIVLKQLIEQARTLGISCSICGQAPVEYPELIDNLIRWGITSVSVEPDAIASIYKAIARAEQGLSLDKMRKIP